MFQQMSIYFHFSFSVRRDWGVIWKRPKKKNKNKNKNKNKMFSFFKASPSSQESEQGEKWEQWAAGGQAIHVFEIQSFVNFERMGKRFLKNEAV